MKKVLLFATFTLVLSVSVIAQERTPKVNARQNSQHARIFAGRNSGEQTRHETALLRKEQKHIRRSERRAKVDGNVTVDERRRLDRKQDRASRHINRANNNEVTPN